MIVLTSFKKENFSHRFERGSAADEVKDDIMSFPLHPLRHRKRHLTTSSSSWPMSSLASSSSSSLLSSSSSSLSLLKSHLVKLVPPTSNVVHQNLVGGELKFNRCPDHVDVDNEQDGDDVDYDYYSTGVLLVTITNRVTMLTMGKCDCEEPKSQCDCHHQWNHSCVCEHDQYLV